MRRSALKIAGNALVIKDQANDESATSEDDSPGCCDHQPSSESIPPWKRGIVPPPFLKGNREVVEYVLALAAGSIILSFPKQLLFRFMVLFATHNSRLNVIKLQLALLPMSDVYNQVVAIRIITMFPPQPGGPAYCWVWLSRAADRTHGALRAPTHARALSFCFENRELGRHN